MSSTSWFTEFPSADVPLTWFRLDLNSSALHGVPPTNISRDGVVRDIGVTWFDHVGIVTPWTHRWDPMRLWDDQSESDGLSNPGWNFYNALHWSLRFDLSTGYMQLNHSWYCDDKDPERP